MTRVTDAQDDRGIHHAGECAAGGPPGRIDLCIFGRRLLWLYMGRFPGDDQPVVRLEIGLLWILITVSAAFVWIGPRARILRPPTWHRGVGIGLGPVVITVQDQSACWLNGAQGA